MADLLTLNAVKKVQKTLNKAAVTSMPRPEHSDNMVSVIGGSAAACICIPDTANEMTIEMWGEGGQGAGSYCCRNGIFGGQGGDYGVKVVDLSAAGAQTLCVCACTCTCAYNCCCGHPGQCSRVTNCTANNTHIVQGGHGGCTCCFWNAGSSCGSCNTQFNTKGMASPSNLVGFTTERAVNVSNLDNATTEASSTIIDGIFAPVECACFDTYKRGACGWSGHGNDAGCSNNCYDTIVGVGGASYAGGDQQICNSLPNNYNHQGACGHFPGGGGASAGTTSSSMCCGGYGGKGLILVSWK